MRRWGFLTNHAMVLIHVIQHPQSTVREIALCCGITERATLSILRDLRSAGIIEGTRQGRRNLYAVNFEALSRYRREGPTANLLPDVFVGELVKELVRLSARRGRVAAAAMPENVAVLRRRASG